MGSNPTPSARFTNHAALSPNSCGATHNTSPRKPFLAGGKLRSSGRGSIVATGVFSATRASIKERTLRTDRWWLQPAITVAVLVSFIIYATFRAFEKNNYFAEPLISPFYSPCLSTACVTGSTHFGTPIGTLTLFGMVISPALFILIFPLGFRLTCYYYRKAYYRSFWM